MKTAIYILKLAVLIFIGICGIAAVDVGHEKDSDLLLAIGFLMNFFSFTTVGVIIHEDSKTK